MSIIDWWYTSFNDGRNISTKDIEEIKDEYPAAYELLKVQNVKSLAVSPFRYKDENMASLVLTIHQKVRWTRFRAF